MSSIVYLNNKPVSLPKGFFDIGVKASFGENIQANLTTEEFTFVLDAYELIRQHVDDGLSTGVGIFEGIPCKIVNSNGSQNYTAFEGMLDLQKTLVIQENLKQCKTRLRQSDSLNQLDVSLRGLDYRYLKEIGVITSSDYVDVDYVINKNVLFYL